jgi:hypothetical protein
MRRQNWASSARTIFELHTLMSSIRVFSITSTLSPVISIAMPLSFTSPDTENGLLVRAGAPTGRRRTKFTWRGRTREPSSGKACLRLQPASMCRQHERHHGFGRSAGPRRRPVSLNTGMRSFALQHRTAQTVRPSAVPSRCGGMRLGPLGDHRMVTLPGGGFGVGAFWTVGQL